jgi:HK97 family phage portal protein
VSKLLNRLRQRFFGSGVTNPQPWLVDYFGGATSASGVKVTVESALALPAVWSSVNVIAGHMGQIPMEVRRRVPGGSEPAPNVPAHKLLNDSPNDVQTAFTFRQTLQAHALLWGNGRALILRNAVGQPTELIILQPSNTYTVMVDGEKWHCTYFEPNYIEDGSVPNYDNPRDPRTSTYKFPDRDVLHIPGLGWNGLWGYKLLSVARNVFGLDDAGIQSAAYMFRNNGRPNLILEAPRGTLTTYKEAEEFLTWFRHAHEGIDNTAKTGLLREGITAKPLPMDAADAQYLESRKFSREDISLLLGTEYLMGQAAAVYKDLAERQSAYVTNTLARWMETWEQEIRRKMLSEVQRSADSHFIQADARGLMKGSPNSLADYTAKMRTQGAMSGNEAREIHGLNSEPGLDDFSNPMVGQPAEPEEPETKESEEKEPEPDRELQNRAQQALAYNFRSLINHEMRRVCAIAEKPNEFMAKLDAFYESFHGKLEATCSDLGIPVELATEHCEESQRQLLELSGVVVADGLKPAVVDMVANWEQRSEVFGCSKQ